MFKKKAALLFVCILCLLFGACGVEDNSEAATTTQGVDDAVYSDITLPDYKESNPVRYLDVDANGFKCNGWQDFGLKGEIRTNAQNPGTTYTSQMYSYFIRNDLKHLYADIELPKELKELPEWLADTTADGRRSFWYSMGRLPESIEVVSTSELTNESGSMKFVMVEYKVQSNVINGDKIEDWVVYFMEDEGVYSAYAVRVNESFDFVKSYSETIVKSYQLKQ